MTRSERGSALVEAGFAIPLLLLLFAGVADFGRVFGVFNAAISAARDGAQVVMNGAADSDAIAAAKGDSALRESAAVVSRFYTCPNTAGDDTGNAQSAAPRGCPGERTYVRLAVSAPFRGVAPHPAFAYPSTVQSTAVVRVR